jgi:hypothetical protein
LTLTFTNGWNLSAESTQADLLFASAQITGDDQVNKDGGPDKVDLTFDHMLSKISFSARNAASDGITLSVKSVKVYGLKKTAKSVLVAASGNATWSLETASTKDSPFNTQSHTQAVILTKENTTIDGQTKYKYTEISSPFMVFPETVSFVVEVTYDQTFGGTTTEATKKATISTTRAAGYEYDFNLKVTEDGINIDGEPIVNQWITTEGGKDLVADGPIVM